MNIDIGTPVPEDAYKSDLALLDRYQNYSSELIRLSLLGIGALAFFLGQVSARASYPSLKDGISALALGSAAVLFTLATACALSHRYHSSDGFASHIKAIRLSTIDPDAAQREAKLRNRTYKKSGRWLGAAVVLFGAGGFLFSFVIARQVYLWVTSAALTC